MAFRHFPTRTAVWLLAELAKLEDELVKGKTITDASAGDASSRQAVQIGIVQRMQMVKYDLCILDPVTYPPEDYLGDSTTFYGAS